MAEAWNAKWISFAYDPRQDLGVFAFRRAFSFSEGSVPPLIKFPAAFGVVERSEAPVLPLTVRSIEDVVAGSGKMIGGALPAASAQVTDVTSILDALKRLQEWRESPEKRLEPMLPTVMSTTNAKAFEVPRPVGGNSFEVVGVPLPGPGFHILEVASPSFGKPSRIGSSRSSAAWLIPFVTASSGAFMWRA